MTLCKVKHRQSKLRKRVFTNSWGSQYHRGEPLWSGRRLHHRQRWHSRLDVMPAVTRAGIAANSFVACNANSRSNSAHLAAIVKGTALSEL